MNKKLRLAAIFSAAALAAKTSPSIGASIRTVAFTGQTGPDGRVYNSFRANAYRLPGGAISFGARTGPDNVLAVYHGNEGSFSLVARVGSGPFTRPELEYIGVNSGGALVINYTDGVPPAYFGLARTDGSLTRIVGSGDVFPPVPGSVIGNLRVHVQANERFVYTGTIAGGGANSLNNVAFVVGHSSNVGGAQMLIRSYDPVPGLPPESLRWKGFSVANSDWSADRAIADRLGGLATLQNPAGFDVSSARFSLQADNSIRMLGVQGADAPGGGQFGVLNDSSFPSFAAGQLVAFRAALSGTSATSGIFVDDSNSLTRVLAAGDFLASLGATINPDNPGFFNRLVDFEPDGRFLANVSLSTVGSALIFGSSSSDQVLVAHEGQAVGPNLTLSSFQIPRLASNANGQVVFAATLAGMGVNANNDWAVFTFDPALGLQMAFREGDMLEVLPGDFRQLRQINVLNSDGIFFDDDGNLSFQGLFIGGGQGIFATSIALPTWNVNADGNWSNAANWQVGVPNSLGATANFKSAIVAPHTVTVDTLITVGRINFDNLNSYTIAGPNMLTIDVANGAGSINVVRGSHTISAALALQDNLNITVIQPTDTLTLSGDITAAVGVGITKNGPGTAALKHVRADSVSVNAGTLRVLPNGSASGTSRVKSLSLAGGATPTATLDITNNGVVVDYEAASPLADIRALIIAGRNGGDWDGRGITSSTAAANSSTHSIGYAEAAELGLTMFMDQPLDPTAVVLRYTRLGDANIDGVVNLGDFNILASNFGSGGRDWFEGDFTYDGIVNLADFNRLAGNFGLSAGPDGVVDPDDWAALAAAVPEPASLKVVLALGLACGRRSRRCASC